jgi:endonuclease YncB( thermonuclease family)
LEDRVPSSPPALSRWRRSAIPVLLIAACAGGCGSTKDAAGTPVQSTSAASTTSTPTSTSTTPPPTRVREVVDGRTLIGATGKRLQVVGLAAPGACWAKAATEFATTTLSGKQVQIVAAAGDQVGVLLPDGSDFAETALRKGMARAESTANSTLTAAQAVAQQSGVGLWGSTCKGADTVAPPPPPPPATTVRPVAPPPTASTPDQPASAYYKNCTAARAAGVTPLHRGEPGYGSHLDRDGDGIACE